MRKETINACRWRCGQCNAFIFVRTKWCHSFDAYNLFVNEKLLKLCQICGDCVDPFLDSVMYKEVEEEEVKNNVI